jgi:mevalonate kinase
MRARTAAVGKASAKLIVLGEHFVVTGAAALAIPLPGLNTEVRLTQGSEIRCELDASAESLGFADTARDLMERALRFATDRYQWDLGRNPLHAFSISNFPSSRGLGSSASFSVALTRALNELSEKETDIRTEAQQIENLFHGKSSGLDTSAIVSPNPVLYQDGKILRTFAPVAVDFVVADSGPRETSSALVSRSMEIRRNQPELWQTLSNQVSELARTCLQELEKQDGATEVARIIRNSQEILGQIGLSNKQLEDLLELGHKEGALAGKMSGAGAGGVVLFVTRRGDGQQLARRLKTAGAKVVTVA